MRIIYIDKSLQCDTTHDNIQLIDGKIYHWCVKTEMLKHNETLQLFLKRKTAYVNLKKPEINTILIYDVVPIESALMVRYALITT